MRQHSAGALVDDLQRPEHTDQFAIDPGGVREPRAVNRQAGFGIGNQDPLREPAAQGQRGTGIRIGRRVDELAPPRAVHRMLGAEHRWYVEVDDVVRAPVREFPGLLRRLNVVRRGDHIGQLDGGVGQGVAHGAKGFEAGHGSILPRHRIAELL